MWSRYQSAEYLAGLYKAKVVNILGPEQWWRVNSLVTDTCSTVCAVWKVLQDGPDTQHLLFVPCDSHGLQLLIKDILEKFPYNRILEKASEVVSLFRRAKKQMAIFMRAPISSECICFVCYHRMGHRTRNDGIRESLELHRRQDVSRAGELVGVRDKGRAGTTRRSDTRWRRVRFQCSQLCTAVCPVRCCTVQYRTVLWTLYGTSPTIPIPTLG